MLVVNANPGSRVQVEQVHHFLAVFRDVALPSSDRRPACWSSACMVRHSSRTSAKHDGMRLVQDTFIRLLNPSYDLTSMASQKDASALSTYGSTTGPTQPSSFAESMAPYVAEFIGTYLLVFTIAVFGIAESADFGGTAIGTLLAVLVYSLGPVSGGHFNPAVSFACANLRF